MKIPAVLVPIVVGAASAAVVVVPAAASAAPPATVHAETHLTDRPDSGGNGDWASDNIRRTLTITRTGPGTYKATVRDDGSFKTIRGAYTPNQGAPYTGQKISGQVDGQMDGEADYTFTASSTPSGRLVPSRENGAPVTGPQTTSYWFEQAFPAGTVFGGAGLGNWNWAYAARVPSRRGVRVQRWDDGVSNSGGQVPAAGNITG